MVILFLSLVACTGDDTCADGSSPATLHADGDGDGFGDAAAAESRCGGAGWVADATDCDDADPATNPAASEVCGDGADNDCDGTSNTCAVAGSFGLTELDAVLGGVTQRDQLGDTVAAVGDLDGDGVGDFVAGAPGWNDDLDEPGAVYVLSGPPDQADAVTPAAFLWGSGTEDRAGWHLAAVGDLSGDGVADLVVGASRAARGTGELYFLPGPVAGVSDLQAAADGWVTGEGTADDLGLCHDGAGDVDGDGAHEVLVGAPSAAANGYASGVVYVVGAAHLGAADGMPSVGLAVLEGAAQYDQAGRGLAGGADVDGDGVVDAAVGAPFNATGGDNAGAVYVALGPLTGTRQLTDADAVFTGAAEDRAGEEVRMLPDADGDGTAEVLVASYAANGGAGVAWMIEDATLDGTLPSQPRVSGVGADELGRDVAAGDVDGDGRTDVAVGVPGTDSEAGLVALFYGGFTGSMAVSDADLRVAGTAAGDNTGRGVALGDVTGDAWADLLIGSPYGDYQTIEPGTVHVWYGEGL